MADPVLVPTNPQAEVTREGRFRWEVTVCDRAWTDGTRVWIYLGAYLFRWSANRVAMRWLARQEA